MDFLNSKERKKFYQQLNKHYGYEGPRELALFEGGAGKIYAISKDLDKIPFTQMRVGQGGLYVANTKGDDLRLTMDGAMLFGEHCNDCFVDVDEEQKNAWMAGHDIAYHGPRNGFVLIRHHNRILGCGSVAHDKTIKNYVPKGRRISDPH